MPCFGVKLPKDAPLKRLNQREGEGDGIAGCTNHDIFEPKKPSFEAWTCPDKRKTITNAKPKEGGRPHAKAWLMALIEKRRSRSLVDPCLLQARGQDKRSAMCCSRLTPCECLKIITHEEATKL